MPIVINGSGTVTGLSVGGLPDGTVDTDTLANGAVTAAKKGAGSVLQVLQDTHTAQYGQGTSGTTTYTITDLSQAITLSSASNKVLVQVSLANAASDSGYISLVWWINRSTGGSDNALTLGDQVGSNRGRGARNTGRAYHDHQNLSDELTWLDTPGSVGPHTYNIQFKDHNGDGSSFYLNRAANDGDTADRCTCVSSITVTEIAA
jgi:hypothetical protein